MKRAVGLPFAAGVLGMTVLGMTGTIGLAEPVGITSPYLQARQAAMASDYPRAAEHYALAVARDPGNRALMESAVSAALAAGDTRRAAQIARVLDRNREASQIAAMALVVDRAATGEWGAVLRAQSEGREVGPLVDALARGWALMGRGEGEAALDAFGALARSDGLSAFGRFHEALLRAALRDWAGAERVMAGRDEAGEKVRDPIRLNRRTALLRASLLSRLGRNDHAIALIDHLFGDRPDPGVASMRARLVAGERIPYVGPTTAREGMAEAFFTVAAALKGDAAHGYVLLYAQAAAALKPDHGDAVLLGASLLRDLERHEEAAELYAAVPADHPAHTIAELGRAAALRARGRGAEAAAALAALGARHPEAAHVQIALGDALRAEGRDAEAVAAYDRALAVHEDPSEASWGLHYARAVSRERMGDWDGARADLGRALEIAPDQPRVLHHLGAAMADRGEPLNEALGLIRRALEGAPENGAMAGSLGWTLYRMGRVEEAVAQLERAAVLDPLDARLNDHLGDALWSAGRQREARFQWRRALDLGPGREAAALLRRKIDRGLGEDHASRRETVTLAADR